MTIPTIIPPWSEAAKRAGHLCHACETLVCGAAWDATNNLCAQCSVALGASVLEDYDLQTQWSILQRKRKELAP